MYVSPGEKEPFHVEYALDFNEWKMPVKNHHLKCQCSVFYVPELKDYFSFEADFVYDNDIPKVKFKIEEKEFEITIDRDYWDSIEKFYIDPIDKEKFIDECVSMIRKYDGIWFGTGSEEARCKNSYYDIFLDILLDGFPFYKYNLDAFCSDFWSHFGSYYQSIGIRKADEKKGVKPQINQIEFPPSMFKPL